MSGLECVLFVPTEETNKYNKHGVVFVGIRHASEQVLQKFSHRLQEEAQIREDDGLLTPADILEMVCVTACSKVVHHACGRVLSLDIFHRHADTSDHPHRADVVERYADPVAER